MPSHVLVPVDGSPQSLQALEFVSTEWNDVHVTLLHVINPVQRGYRANVLPSGSEDWYLEAKADAESILDDAGDQLDLDESLLTTRTEVGRPATTIVEIAGEGAVDHVVVGSHGRRGVSRLILGSVAEHVARRSPVPVTIVK